MNELQIKAILAGICFGLYPLFLNRSGLNGNMSSLVLVSGGLMIILPVIIADRSLSSSGVWWMMAVCGIIFFALGTLCFNGMLSKVSPDDVGSMFVLMIAVEITIPKLYEAILMKELSTVRVVGFVIAGAVVVASLLLEKSKR